MNSIDQHDLSVSTVDTAALLSDSHMNEDLAPGAMAFQADRTPAQPTPEVSMPVAVTSDQSVPVSELAPLPSAEQVRVSYARTRLLAAAVLASVTSDQATAKAALDSYLAAVGLPFGSDDYRGRFFADQHHNVVGYLPDQDQVMAFDNDVWAKGRVRARKFAIQTAKELRRQSKLMAFEERNSVFDRAPQEAMVDRAKAHLMIPSDSFDKDSRLLNVANGTLDLRTGVLRPHNAADKITLNTGVAYDPSAQCPIWIDLMGATFAGVEGLPEFAQRVAGLFLLGDNPDHKFFIFHGPAGSGKSSFLNTLVKVMGSYAKATSVNTLAGSGNNLTFTDSVAQLAGKRLVVVDESSDTSKLRAAFVKGLSAGDPIEARLIRSGNQTFFPVCTPCLTTNCLPIIDGSDDGLGRRLRVITCSNVVPEAHMDLSLKDKLVAEYPGILAWMARGLQSYWELGLNTPDKVMADTSIYRTEMDDLSEFFETCIERNPEGVILARAIQDTYKQWCTDNGTKPVAERSVGSYLKNKQRLESKPIRGKRSWLGVVLKGEPVSEPASNDPLALLTEESAAEVQLAAEAA